MAKPYQALAVLLLAAPLAAQTYIVSGDSNLTLTHLLHDHPEGMLLTMPSAKGLSLNPTLTATLDQDPALELQVGTQEVDRHQPLGRELAALRAWSPETPHWALLGPNRQVFAEGTEAPTAEQLAELYHRSPLRTRAERLREFLKENPGHVEALALLVLELRTLGERRTEKALAMATPSANQPPATSHKEVPQPFTPLPAESEDTPRLPGQQPTEKLPAKPEPDAPILPVRSGVTKQATPMLAEADDARIWGEYAERYEQFMRTRAWPGPIPSDASPLPLAAQLATLALNSPRLQGLANRLLPDVEARLQVRPSDERRWKVWLTLREAGAGGRPGELLAGLVPPPGAKHWPPSAAIDAFVEDAQERNDWHDAEPVLQAAYDRNQDLLKALDAAAREDAIAHPPAQLGSYFGFGAWNGETSLLAEAKLRLGKPQEADQIFREAFARAPRPEIAGEAAALARRCGVESMAEQWERLGSEKD